MIQRDEKNLITRHHAKTLHFNHQRQKEHLHKPFLYIRVQSEQGPQLEAKKADKEEDSTTKS